MMVLNYKTMAAWDKKDLELSNFFRIIVLTKISLYLKVLL